MYLAKHELSAMDFSVHQALNTLAYSYNDFPCHCPCSKEEFLYLTNSTLFKGNNFLIDFKTHVFSFHCLYRNVL
jgi:hypothetical protein